MGNQEKDALAEQLASSLNKKFKDYKVAYFLDGSEDTPTDLTEWISTGSSMLDLCISNRPNGGIPVGRITEITGLEASGKSLVAAQILANTQKKGTNTRFMPFSKQTQHYTIYKLCNVAENVHLFNCPWLN